MDDLIKLILELTQRRPIPKGGIANTPEAIEFIGRKLSKQQKGDLTVVGSKLTDASRFIPFSIRNVGRDKRYSYIYDYEQELLGAFNKTLEFIRVNPDIRLTRQEKDNIIYNIGVLRRISSEKNKLEKGILSEGKKPEEVYANVTNEKPIEELSLSEALERLTKETEDIKKKADDLFKKEELTTDEKQIRYKKLYEGKGYQSGNSGNYRGYGSFFLPKLHEAGIIKLDDEILANLNAMKHHHGGAEFFAPDPIRIWRKHFGEGVFDKLDNFDPDNESIFDWLKRNDVSPISVEGPKNALEYMTPGELKINLAEEVDVFNKYRNPKGQGGFFEVSTPQQRLERLGYHGTNINRYEKALQKIDPESFREYASTKAKIEESSILPFVPKEDLAEGGIVGLYI